MGFFHAGDFDALFEQARAAPWERAVLPRLGLKITKVRTNRSRLKAETSIQSVVHKAAAEKLCKSGGLARLPETDSGAEVRVYIEKDMVSLLLDLSGEPLFKRGYRIEGGIAPLRETTAAAMLLIGGWKRKYPLYDPFCGSGTVLAEALMYAWDMAPGLGRKFAISDLLIADSLIEETVRNEFRGKINFERLIRISGGDEDPASVSLAQTNLRRALDLAEGRKPQRHYTDAGGVKVLPEIKAIPMNRAKQELPPAAGENSPKADEPAGFIVTNPPYGKRLGDAATSEKNYRDMVTLARNFPGWKLAVITDHSGFESFFGKKANSCREITGGPIPTYFFQYEKL
jgi:putative N6-adenine-specific DNA methylase